LRTIIGSIADLFVPDKYSEENIVAGSLRGYRILVNLKHEKRYWLGAYEHELEWAVKNLELEGRVAYDVGASIGYTTLLLAQAVGKRGRVIAFEPLPENARRLRINIELNGLSQAVRVVERSIMHMDVQIPFLTHKWDAMGRLEEVERKQDVLRERIMVQGETIDHFVYQEGNPGPDFLKIDVEGAEALVLQGAARLLAEARPPMIIELHGPEVAKEVWQILSPMGYSFHALAEGFPEVERIPTDVEPVRLFARSKSQSSKQTSFA